MNKKNPNGNRLVNEKSPYLLQHAHNPVDWYPWGDEAFNKAKAENKPIFLSIGYSTCHWCHVMERESFEDQEVAEVLNNYFVAVKVDREERPDIDHIYMTVCQVMTGHGGWPLTVILTPDKKPFFSGTYFPKQRRGQMPGLLDILGQIRNLWTKNREKVLASSHNLTQALEPHLTGELPGEINEKDIHRAFHQLRENFDAVYGGFSTPPKFPTPHLLGFLMRYWDHYGEKSALEMVLETLDGMSLGGIFDHIGGGFSRYSTDRPWLVPHFEKMLYDNALLTIAYLEAYQITGKESLAETAREILNYIRRDMTSPEGGFFSAEDADSEGVEGQFYLWTPEEVKAVLGSMDGDKFCSFYNITAGGNFEGKNIPNLIAQEQALEIKNRFRTQRQLLFEHREKRIHPFKDDKVLTSWNGLMIAALAKAARILEEHTYQVIAEKAAGFLLTKMRRPDGRLLARYREDEAAYLAYLDDYAFFIQGLMELYQVTFRPSYLLEAINLSKDLIQLFWDEKKGGCFIYGADAEQLPARPKEIYDGATPSGNSTVAHIFLLLAGLTGDQSWEEKSRRIFHTFGETVNSYPAGHCHLLSAFLFALRPFQKIVLAGNPEEKDFQQFVTIINKKFLPQAVLLAADPALEPVVPLTGKYQPLNNKATAFICEGFSCQPPITCLEELEKKFNGK